MTGYDMIWFHLRNLTGLLVITDRDETVFFDGRGHTTIISTTPEIGEVVWFGEYDSQGGDVETIARGIEARGLGRSRIAVQTWGHSPHASVTGALEARLGAAGAQVCDGSLVIEEVRLVKSERELEVIRRAAEMADEAMAAARDAIAPGVLETEIEAVIMSSLMRGGGGYPGIRSMIGSGPRSGTHHSPAQHRRLQQGGLVFIDFCASLHRYHVNLNRTFSIGQPDSRWVDLMSAAAGCIEAVIREVKPGDDWSKAAEVGERYIDEHGLRKYLWWVGGYAPGIGFPLDWCGAYWIAPHEGVPDRPVVPGMVFNYENQFDVWEDWPGCSGAAYIETFAVTNAGLEVLSKLPRTLTVV